MRATRLHRLPLIACAILILLSLGSRAVADDLADEDPLLNFFSSTCASTSGEWTQTALKKANDLKSVLIEIANNPDCQIFSAEVTSVTAITNSLNSLNLQIANNSSESSLLTSEFSILSTLSTVSDPAASNDLKNLLTQVDARLVSTSALDRLQSRASAANDLITSTHGLLEQAMNNRTCLLSQPKVLASVGSLVATVGAAVTAINPVVGLATAAAGSLISGLVDLSQKSSLSKAVHRLSDTAIKPQAFSCVMESLSDDYCRAVDAMSILDWESSHKSRTTYPVTSPLYGLGILDRELPTFMNWLITLKGGNAAQNHYDAEKISDFLTERNLYESSKPQALGIIGESTANISNASPDNIWPLTRNLVDSIVDKLGGSNPFSSGPTVKNPLFKQYLNNEAKFLLIGIHPVPINNLTNLPTEFDSYIPLGAIPKLDEIKNNFFKWYDDTSAIVASDQSIALQTDPATLLENAFHRQQDFNRTGADQTSSAVNNSIVNPYQSLVNIIAFLQSQLDQNPNADESMNYLPETIDGLKSIQAKLLTTHVARKTKTTQVIDYGGILSQIYQIAQLGSGSIYFRDRLNNHIENALSRYLSDPKNATDAAPILIQTLASKRMTDLLTHNDADADKGKIRDDIEGSSLVVQPIFNYFINTFQSELTKVLRYYLAQETAIYVNQPKAVLSYHRARAKMCLLISEAPQWPRKIPYFELCDGTSTDRLPGGPVSPKLTQDFIQGPHSCTYYHLKQDTLIYSTKMGFAQ